MGEEDSQASHGQRHHPATALRRHADESAYCLRYSWTAWPSQRRFHETPTDLLADLAPLWEIDGLRLLEHRWTDRQIQLLFSTRLDVSPYLLTHRAKGRLGYAIRQARLQMPLSRKVSVRSLGENVTREVHSYIEQQVDRAYFADARFRSRLGVYTVINRNVKLARPSQTKRGRYWYNLHVVLLTIGRYGIVDDHRLAAVRDISLKIAAKHGHLISRLSVMPDHLHLALRGALAHSPNDIAAAFLNNLAHVMQQRLWRDGFYAGTFGEYDMGAIRGSGAARVGESSSPTRQARGGRPS